MIDINKRYTSGGAAIRILCVDGPGDYGPGYYPVIGVVSEGVDKGTIRTFTLSGKWYNSVGAPTYDLVEVEEQEIWVNVYPEYVASVHPNRIQADRNAGPKRIACVKVTYKVGGGL